MRDSLTNFYIQSDLGFRALFHWLTPISYVSNVFVRPVMILPMWGFLGRFAGGDGVSESLITGMAVYSIGQILSGGIIQSNANDLGFGTLSEIYVTPANRLVLFLSRGVAHIPNAILAFTTVLVVAWIALGLDLSQAAWGTIVLAVAATIVAAMSFALAASNIALITRSWVNVSAGTVGVLLGLTGVIIPSDQLPGALGAISQALPITHGLKAVREGIAGTGPGTTGDLIAAELLVAVGYFVAGYALFRVFEIHARRTGALERL